MLVLALGVAFVVRLQAGRAAQPAGDAHDDETASGGAPIQRQSVAAP